MQGSLASMRCSLARPSPTSTRSTVPRRVAVACVVGGLPARAAVGKQVGRGRGATVVVRATPEEPKQEEEPVPVWVQREQEAKAKAESGEKGPLPYGLYLLGASLIVIAVVGSCFELANQNALFGVIQPDNFLYYPILGVFILTGLPSAGVLWSKATKAANDEADRLDKADGYK